MSIINKVLLKSLIVNTILVISKITVGIIGSSKVLIADGIHSLSDLATDIIAIVGSKLSSPKSDEKHPYGHGKVEYLTSLIIGIIVLIIGINLISSAFTTERVIPSEIVLYVAIFCIILKYILSSYLIKKGKYYNNNILISSGKESRSDVYGSVVVVISYIGSKLEKISEIFRYSDSIGTIVIGILILKTSYIILKENNLTKIGEIETDEKVITNIKKIILTNSEIKNIDKLVILKYGSYYQAEIEISLDSNMDLENVYRIKNEVKDNLLNSNTKISYIKISALPYMEVESCQKDQK